MKIFHLLDFGSMEGGFLFSFFNIYYNPACYPWVLFGVSYVQKLENSKLNYFLIINFFGLRRDFQIGPDKLFDYKPKFDGQIIVPTNTKDVIIEQQK